jgi:hypothetical protein
MRALRAKGTQRAPVQIGGSGIETQVTVGNVTMAPAA